MKWRWIGSNCPRGWRFMKWQMWRSTHRIGFMFLIGASTRWLCLIGREIFCQPEAMRRIKLVTAGGWFRLLELVRPQMHWMILTAVSPFCRRSGFSLFSCTKNETCIRCRHRYRPWRMGDLFYGGQQSVIVMKFTFRDRGLRLSSYSILCLENWRLSDISSVRLSSKTRVFSF